MRVVVALGGDGPLRAGQAAHAEHVAGAVRAAAKALAGIAQTHDLLVTHGRGRQESRLAEQGRASADLALQPAVTDAASLEEAIARQLVQELSRLLGPERMVRSVWTQAGVSRTDPAFGRPSHPVGPLYTQEQAQQLAASHQWSTTVSGSGYRRVVAAPMPLQVRALAAIAQLLAGHAVVVASGAGGTPVAASVDTPPVGDLDAVVDPDLFSGLLAHEVGADCLLFATGVASVLADPAGAGTTVAGAIHPQALARLRFARGSIGQQARAASQFVLDGGQRAAIGSLDQLAGLMDGSAGIQVTPAALEPA